MSSLTALSQTDELIPDLAVLAGQPMDPDLRNRTPADSPDAQHETTDQKVGVRVPPSALVEEDQLPSPPGIRGSTAAK